MICDFAEFYHVLNWRELPVRLAATLAAGLPEYSRCKKKAAGLKGTTQELLLARITDQLAVWLWANSKNAERPHSFVEDLLVKETEQPKHKVFRSKEAFEAELAKYIGG